MPFLRPVPGTPATPLPIGGRPNRLPKNTLSEHEADTSDPHGTRALVPALRTGTGVPSVTSLDKATDFYFDTSSRFLYVCVSQSGSLSWQKVSDPAVPAVPDGVYNFSHMVGTVKHYKRQVLSYDEEMAAYTLSFTGDYVRQPDGSYVGA